MKLALCFTLLGASSLLGPHRINGQTYRRHRLPRHRRPPFVDYQELPNVVIPNVLTDQALISINATHEIIGSWIALSRYLVHILVKEPVRAGKYRPLAVQF